MKKIMTISVFTILASCFAGSLAAQNITAGTAAEAPRNVNGERRGGGEGVAQDTTYRRITTANGNRYVGRMVSENDTEIVLEIDELGRVTIHRADIEKMDAISSSRIVDGRYWYENPHATRYFFSTSARPIGARRGYYQNTWVLFNNLNVGLSPNISLGGGLIPLFLMGGTETPAWLLPKISIPLQSDRLYLAAGAMIGGVLGAQDAGVGVVYGVGTLGTGDSNMTFGIGYGYAGSEWSDSPMVNLSFMHRTSRSFYLLSENYLFDAGDTSQLILSGGFRWAPENFAVDFGLFVPTGEGEFFGIPWLGVTLPFGN